MDNQDTHPSQLWGRSEGYITYLRNAPSIHYCTLRSVPLTVEEATKSHMPVFCPRSRRQSSMGGSDPVMVTSEFSASSFFRNRISARPSLIIWVCPPHLNPNHPRRAATRCPVTTYYDIHLSCVVYFGYRRAIPAFLTWSLVTSFPGIWASAPWKSYWRNYLQKAFSAGSKSSPSTCMASCMKYHYYWRIFCRNVYAVCGLHFSNPDKVFTPNHQSYTLYPSHVVCASGAPMYPPSYWLNVMILRPRQRKKVWYRETFLLDITKMLLVRSGK